MDKDFLAREAENNPFSPYSNKAEMKSAAPREASFPEEASGFLPFFFVELLHRFRNTLNSIKTFSRLSREKVNDLAFREQFYRAMDEDIEEIESVMNSLLSYIKINTPIIKSDTLHIVLEDVLKKYESQLNSRKIKIIKKFGKKLPETMVHEQQLRYIFNSILQYAISLTLPTGSIGFLTRVSEIQKETDEKESAPERDRRQVEIVIIFTGYKKQGEQFETTLGTQPALKEEKMDLQLLLVKEIVRKNHGIIKFEVNEKKPRTQISLSFPVERRRVVSYQFPGP